MTNLTDTRPTLTVTDKAELSAQMDRIMAYIETLAALPTKDRHVQVLGSFFVQHTADTLTVGGIQHATTYSTTELEAMAAHGVGTTPYRNGNGETSKLITMREGVMLSVAMQLKTLELYRDILNK